MSVSPRVCAVILAAGSGRRAGRSKQFARASGRTLLYHACLPFLRAREIHGLVVVVPRGRGPVVTEELDDMRADKVLAVVRGGATRHESSRAGLAALPASCTTVLLHDAARPFATPALLRRLLGAIETADAAIPVLPVTDATIELDAEGRVRSYLDRSCLRRVQTPQVFRRSILEKAFARADADDHPDDASLVLAAGGEIGLVEGEESNWKVTNAAELAHAIGLLEARGPVTAKRTKR